MEIESERLMLRPFKADDEKVFTSFFTDPDFMRYSRVGAVSEAKARDHFRERLARSHDQFTKLAVIEKSSKKVIGYCGVETWELDGNQELELGYRLTASARGQGYATEAARAVLNYYRAQGITNIFAYTAPDNYLSQNVLKKLGFKVFKSGVRDSFPIIIFRR